MKLMVSAKPFTAELKSVLPAVATRSGLPMLSGVRLEASDGVVSIEATDLELTARRVVHGAVTVDGAGSVVVPAKALVKAVAAMGEPEIVLESHSSDGQAGLDVQAGTRTVSLQGWPSEDWPAVPQMAAIDPIASIDASAVVDAFERVALCASSDEARPVLTCAALFFREDPAALEVVATDSYRLGVAHLPLEAGFRVSDGPLLVPARAVKLLAKQLKGAEGAVLVRALEASGAEPSHASRIAFTVPAADWTVRTVEGEFPNWKQVVPNPRRPSSVGPRSSRLSAQKFHPLVGRVLDLPTYSAPSTTCTALSATARRMFVQCPVPTRSAIAPEDRIVARCQSASGTRRPLVSIILSAHDYCHPTEPPSVSRSCFGPSRRAL